MLRLKYERLQRCWSQTLLGTLVHRSGHHRRISQPEICLFELGRLTPEPDELQALGRALGVEPADALLQPVLIADGTTGSPA